MTMRSRLLISILIALTIWTFFSWPIPQWLTEGISSSSLNTEKGGTRAMISGDHLQFLYQFWLTGDTIRGHTPAFVNPYEFNIGNDADGAFRGTYYIPFSLFYAIGEAVGGRAFGYNFNQLVTVWITFLFTWLLVRRYCRDEWVSLAAAVVGATLPYSWITMFDGSPTGLAMMWIPVIFWALDILVAERKLWAGAVAGIGICLAEADSHVFFFAILSSPVWCVFSYLFHFPGRRPSWGEARCILRASLLLIVFLGAAAWLVWSIRHSVQDTSLVATHRSVEEIRANSPILSGTIRPGNEGEGRKIYVGGYLLALLAAGGLTFLRLRRREPAATSLPLQTVVLLGVAILGVALLSTGVLNPGGARAWKLLTTLLPPYGMIRQPHKIYCLMPVLLALAAGILWPILLRGVAERWRAALLMVLIIPVVLDYGRRIHPAVCLLDREQGAFRAIADDAKAAGNSRPHLLSLPIWPGDSHYDSLNEYYISLYGLRMVNGYGGTVRESYRTNIFERLESMNIGSISDQQLDFLLKRGVGYLVLHEDCFPEKVSPFPVGQTLESLLNHPRLKSIGKDGAMWSFKILPPGEAETANEKVSFMKYYFPTRSTPLTPVFNTVPPSLAPAALSLSWLVRARGAGAFRVSNVVGGVTNSPSEFDVASRDWMWTKVDIPAGAGAAGVGAVFTRAKGAVNLDQAILTAGDWQSPAPGERIELPAACFFHAGHTDRKGEWVTLRAAYEPQSIVFYGPKLPLEKGTYSAGLVFESEAPAGTLLGRFNIRWDGNETEGWTHVTVGLPSVLTFEQKDNRPFLVAFEFLRAADVRIRSVILVRQR
jgi:hypothetical protein